jgi:hypothetical protein
VRVCLRSGSVCNQPSYSDSEAVALNVGMKEKAKEFVAAGGEIYRASDN